MTITIIHKHDGYAVQAFKRDRKICAPHTRDHVSYVLCLSKPNYPVPAIRYHDRLINWHGKMIFVVTHDHEWNGFQQFVADYNL